MPIRLLTEADVEAYRALRLEMLRGDPQAFGSSAEEFETRTLESVAERLNPDEAQFTLGAFEDGALIGVTTFVRETALKMRHKGNIYGVYVTPAARGRGVAAKLLRETVQRAREMPGLDVLMLAVSEPQTAARSLYERAGFVVWGTEPDALRVNEESLTEFYMRLELRK